MKKEIVPNTFYGYLAGYRSELMGIAILMVLWFHVRFSFNYIGIHAISVSLKFIKELTYCGVDIFVLVSGFGIWHSLKKQPVSGYFLNRLKKILPIWWTYLAIRFILDTLLYHLPIKFTEILSAVFFTGFWQDKEMPNQGNWFVYTIMLFYLIAPILFALLYHSRRNTLTAFLLVVITAAVSFSFFCDYRLIAVSRLPIFVVGFYLASDPERFFMNGKKWLAAIGICIAGVFVLFGIAKWFPIILWDYGCWWYPFIIIAPAAAVLICKLFSRIDPRSAHIGRFFRLLGAASLEILLASDFIYTHFGNPNYRIGSDNFKNVILLVISLFVGLLIHALIERIKGLCAHR